MDLFSAMLPFGGKNDKMKKKRPAGEYLPVLKNAELLVQKVGKFEKAQLSLSFFNSLSGRKLSVRCFYVIRIDFGTDL